MKTFNLNFFNTIKKNPLLTEVFDYDPRSFEDIDDYKREFDGEIEENIINNTTWLYRGDGRLTMMLGLYKDNIIAISDDFFLLKFCDYFQDIPFEIYRLKFDFFENERETYINNLKKYEQWCRDNNIVVDPNNYYHDENGEIFKRYFELNYEQSIIGLY